jgi:formamidopyrimidine-DNA glycosylase
MPELPEIEIIRQELSRDVVGLKVKEAAVTTGKTVKRHKTAKAFRDLLEGRTIKSVSRLGTSLVLELDDGSSLVIDAKESGQIRRAKSAKEAKAKHTSVVLTFTKSGQLRFADPKGAGEMYVSIPPAEGTVVVVSPASTVAMGGEGGALRQRVSELAGLGFDPVEDVMSWERFAIVLRARSMPIRTFLVDQTLVTGIGAVYADEICFASGLRPDRATDSLSTTEVRRLWRSLVEILAEATKHGGTTIEGSDFGDIHGTPGKFQDLLEVHGREGESCRRCRRPITKIKVGTRPVFVCERCQI